MPKMTIIDADPKLRESLAFYFTQRKYQVSTYPRAVSAFLNHPRLRQENVILCDMHSEGMGGAEFIRSLRQQGHTTPIILMTDGQDVDLVLEATKSGAFYHAVKPLALEQLAQAVLRASQQLCEPQPQIPLFVGTTPQILSVTAQARRFATTNSSILISGESGTGKDVLARSIHQMSERCHHPFVAINCSAIPDDLLESELFGYARGAFTGALTQKAGLFEEASGGTLFLDEIGDMNYPLQSKLLRVVQERKIRRVGETQEHPIDVRIISATHENLKMLVRERKFREDLYYRLNVVQLTIPPLRDRREDILPLTEVFLRKHAPAQGLRLTDDAKAALCTHLWKGNVRELENVIERATTLVNGAEISAADLSIDAEQEATDVPAFFSIKRRMSLKELSQAYVEFMLRSNNNSRDKTYRELGIDRKTLYRKLATGIPPHGNPALGQERANTHKILGPDLAQ